MIGRAKISTLGRLRNQNLAILYELRKAGSLGNGMECWRNKTGSSFVASPTKWSQRISRSKLRQA